MRFDVAVLGAGVVGLSTARALAKSGAKVVVLDPRQPAGAGSRAAAGVAVASVRLLDDLPMLEFARNGARHLAQTLAALPEPQSLRRGGGILRIAADEKTRELLEQKGRAAPEWLGRWVPGTELAALEPALEGTPLHGAFLSDEGFMVDTGAYLNALQAELRGAGGVLRLSEGAREVTEHANGVTVETDRERLEVDQVVVCAGAWSGGIGGLAPVPVKPMRGQMMTVLPPTLRLTRVVSGPMYFAPWRQGAVVVGATEEDAGFAPHVTAAGLLQLAAALAKSVPALRDAPVGETWAGLRAVTPTGRPLIGRHPGQKRVFLGTGHGGQGILTGGSTGQALATLLGGAAVPEVEPFSP